MLNKAIFISVKKKRNQIFIKLLQQVNNDINIIQHNKQKLFDYVISCKSYKIIDEIFNNLNIDSKFNDILNSFYRVSCEFKVPSIILLQKIYDFDKAHDQLIDLNKTLSDGKTYLTSFKLNIKNIREVVKFFIDNGSDPNIPDEGEVYQFEYAISIHSNEYIFALVESGKIDLKKIIPNKETDNKNTKAKYTTYLHLLSREKNIEIMKYLLDKKMIDINITNDLGETTLIEAYKNGNTEIVDLLFKYNDINYFHSNKECQNVFDLDCSTTIYNTLIFHISNDENNKRNNSKNISRKSNEKTSLSNTEEEISITDDETSVSDENELNPNENDENQSDNVFPSSGSNHQESNETDDGIQKINNKTPHQNSLSDKSIPTSNFQSYISHKENKDYEDYSYNDYSYDSYDDYKEKNNDRNDKNDINKDDNEEEEEEEDNDDWFIV